MRGGPLRERRPGSESSGYCGVQGSISAAPDQEPTSRGTRHWSPGPVIIVQRRLRVIGFDYSFDLRQAVRAAGMGPGKAPRYLLSSVNAIRFRRPLTRPCSSRMSTRVWSLQKSATVERATVPTS